MLDLSNRQPGTRPRDEAGRYVPVLCTDPNCCGKLVWEDGGIWGKGWLCDGLTHDDEPGSPLRACTRTPDDTN